MKADFSGYATKAGLKCSDGLTIMPGAKITINSTGTLVVTKELILLGNARIDNKTGGVVQVTAGGN